MFFDMLYLDKQQINLLALLNLKAWSHLSSSGLIGIFGLGRWPEFWLGRTCKSLQTAASSKSLQLHTGNTVVARFWASEVMSRFLDLSDLTHGFSDANISFKTLWLFQAAALSLLMTSLLLTILLVLRRGSIWKEYLVMLMSD